MNGQILFPSVSEAEIAALKREIADRGAMPPIQVHHGEIVGVSRLIACLHLGILPTFEFPDDDDEPDHSGETSRSAITTAQLAMAAASMSMESTHGGARDRTTAKGVPTVGEAAAMFGVSVKMVMLARKVLQYGDQDLIRRCMLPGTAPKSERLAIFKAAEIVDAKIKQD